MSLKLQITEDMKQAMRDRDSQKLGAIRFLLSEIKNFEIDNGEQDDAGIQNLISKQIKQMKDAISDFQKGDRADLVEAEEQKIVVIAKYLPKQLSDEEIQLIITKVVQDMGENANMGQVIGAVKSQVGNSADGGKIASLVKQVLG